MTISATSWGSLAHLVAPQLSLVRGMSAIGGPKSAGVRHHPIGKPLKKSMLRPKVKVKVKFEPKDRKKIKIEPRDVHIKIEPKDGGIKKEATGNQHGKHIAKKPAASPSNSLEGETAKYNLRAEWWELIFPDDKSTNKAVLAIQLANREKKFMRAGSDVQRVGNRLQIQWNGQVTGKSLYGYFRTHFPKTLGPSGSIQMNFRPLGLETELQAPGIGGTWSKTEPQTVAIGTGTPPQIAAIGALPEEGHLPAIGGAGPAGYLPMPARLAKTSFHADGWWNMDKLRSELDDVGFVCLRAFIPKLLVDKCFEESTQYFLKVLRSFWGGFAIDKGLAGFDDLAALPAKVWDRKLGGQVRLSFVKGSWGFQADPITYQVIAVEAAGQAERLGVICGWVVSEVYDKGTNILVGTSGAFGTVPMWIWWDVDVEMVFQQDVCWTPFALKQKWGVSTSRGYQPKLGLGKCTHPHYVDSPASRDAQLYMRNFLANLHKCLPHELCWQTDGVSFKAGWSFFEKKWVWCNLLGAGLLLENSWVATEGLGMGVGWGWVGQDVPRDAYTYYYIIRDIYKYIIT